MYTVKPTTRFSKDLKRIEKRGYKIDLRDERKLKLQEVSDATKIPLTTVQRIESDEDIRVGYQDVARLAEFYNVSTDYLFGITDNLQHRSVEIDALSLSDNAIETLKSKKLNNRLIHGNCMDLVSQSAKIGYNLTQNDKELDYGK